MLTQMIHYIQFFFLKSYAHRFPLTFRSIGRFDDGGNTQRSILGQDRPLGMQMIANITDPVMSMKKNFFIVGFLWLENYFQKEKSEI